ncbi:hypothetical protein Nepgr_022783 [Nepenthes gracilis]|uniref:Uncharacterized protein n=1 Tax=Nepenthes gracilis TaxID=150966 RepID=A0AAD3XYR5_NEPGR|nr:hypothetical protein Nepgr_022783 [Nepenthes gracilis]
MVRICYSDAGKSRCFTRQITLAVWLMHLDCCSNPFRSYLLRPEEDTFSCSCSWPKCIAIRKKLLGGRNMLQEPSAFSVCDVAGDVAIASLKKHRS